MLRTALCSFLGGAATAGGAGYYVLHQDLYKTHAVLEQSVQTVGASVREDLLALNQRVQLLEAAASMTNLSDEVQRDTVQHENEETVPAPAQAGDA
ncbi:hypothetical protein FVE85_6681 [Porphyridium purpureum]|uniref:Uncharacterized protein n=1 Tax=Porphyridium purpureum TaxID=35688 RepID=A0A5J4Z5Y8_PORPP|nr:hypothetical protein FVE85_6681 [Porphyridium purpureum]|eukprot:POR0681..scf295_1